MDMGEEKRGEERRGEESTLAVSSFIDLLFLFLFLFFSQDSGVGKWGRRTWLRWIRD